MPSPNTTIQICLFAGLKSFAAADLEHYPIASGTTVESVMEEIGLPVDMPKIIFIDGKKAACDRRLIGGERLGIFPPVAGG